MNKEADDLKRLILSLEIDKLIPELTDARKSTKKAFEIINGLDLQSELEFLNNTLEGVDYTSKPIGEQFASASEHLNQATEAFLKLNNQIEDEIKDLRAQEGGTAPAPAPVEEIDVRQIIEEDEAPTPAEKEKEEKEKKEK